MSSLEHFKMTLPEDLKTPKVTRRLGSSRLRTQTYVLWTLAGILFFVHTAYLIYRTLGWEPETHSMSSVGNLLGLEVGHVSWKPCTQLKGVDCGHIIVPKDYFDPSVGFSTIALARYNATKLPKKGTILLNPGGPGGSGTQMATRSGPSLAEFLGHDWDLVGFDPRGIGETKPAVRCFTNALSQHLLNANTVFEQGLTIPSISNIFNNDTREKLIEQQRQFLALKQSQADLCARNMGQELKYMGTATVVRDIDFMTQAFEGKGAKINYYGGSYGSILGAYLVNMLPHRVNRVAIDGIVDPVSWSSQPSHKWPAGWLSSTEKAYGIFLDDCSRAGPTLCPLAKFTGEPLGNIERRIELFLDDVADAPLPVPYGLRPGYLTSGAVRSLLLKYLELPTLWPIGALRLSEAMSGNGTSLFNELIPDTANQRSLSASFDLSRLAVTCLDSPPPESPEDFPTAEQLADEVLHTLEKVSVHFGASTGPTEPDGGCQFWPVRGPERFTGPWNATLETPMLVISNTADPITPIASGLLINSLMPHSTRLIIQDGPGHCSVALPSLCTAKLVRGYFAGELPENGTVCDVDVSTFPDPSASDSQMLHVSAEDRTLMDAVWTLTLDFQEARKPGHT